MKRLPGLITLVDCNIFGTNDLPLLKIIPTLINFKDVSLPWIFRILKSWSWFSFYESECRPGFYGGCSLGGGDQLWGWYSELENTLRLGSLGWSHAVNKSITFIFHTNVSTLSPCLVSTWVSADWLIFREKWIPSHALVIVDSFTQNLPEVSSVVVVGINEIVKIPIINQNYYVINKIWWVTLDHMGHSTIF